jgi:hypothetical protein
MKHGLGTCTRGNNVFQLQMKYSHANNIHNLGNLQR